MSRKVHVDLDERSYDILIGGDVKVGASLGEVKGKRALIISDSNVDKLYGESCGRTLAEAGMLVGRAVVPAGEPSKDLAQVGRLYDEAVRAGLDRSSFIVALGGGMVGDLAGFVAATFMRGIRFIQAPTTLLAMVDSSVGGKTGVNLPQGKNLIGSFYQPVEVAASLETLKTLPEKEYLSGLAEVIKYGVIWDASLFGQLEANADKILARDPELMEAVIARCCEIKAEVVAMDEKETGVRAILNFGHTMGHALEKALGYGTWLHGEAVAAGMAFAVRLSEAQKGFSADEAGRVIALIRRLKLPVSPAESGAKLAWSQVREAMASDKKNVNRIPRFVLAERLAGVAYGCEVPEAALEKVFQSG